MFLKVQITYIIIYVSWIAAVCDLNSFGGTMTTCDLFLSKQKISLWSQANHSTVIQRFSPEFWPSDPHLAAEELQN